MRAEILLCYLLSVVLVKLSHAQPTRKIDPDTSCISIEKFPLCSQIGYSSVFLPNFKNHLNPKEANKELGHYQVLIDSGCSNALLHLLCAVYAPFCNNITGPPTRVPPCRNLCEYVGDGCKSTVNRSGLDWPPGQHLNCSYYPEYEYKSLCNGPEDPSTISAPGITTTTTTTTAATTG